MTKASNNRTEDRHQRADRIAREIIHAERAAREKKTAHLRALRLQKEQEASA